MIAQRVSHPGSATDASTRTAGPGMQDTVLIIEDESDVTDLLRYNLNRAGMTALTANNGNDGLEIARKNRPDIILLDLMLPGINGYEVCKALKRESTTEHIPILMLTAKGEPEERVLGLELGADDYMSKPFSPRELVLRVQALLRRLRHSASRAETLEMDSFSVDRGSMEIRLDGKRMDLTATEFKLLSLMIDRRGRVQSRERLLQDVWGYQQVIDSRTVDTHMRRLREKMGKHASRLETVRGEGYRFNTFAEE